MTTMHTRLPRGSQFEFLASFGWKSEQEFRFGICAPLAAMTFNRSDMG
jgi:hypothetical protein